MISLGTIAEDDNGRAGDEFLSEGDRSSSEDGSLDSTSASAFELATLFREACPESTVNKLKLVEAALVLNKVARKAKQIPKQWKDLTLKERLANSVPASIGDCDNPLDWSRLELAVPSELLKDVDADAELLEINSGGLVMFCFLKPLDAANAQRHEVVVVKFGATRLAMQAEQFANELTRHLDICAPNCRIVRKVGNTTEEWQKAREYAEQAGTNGQELVDAMDDFSCFLLLEFVPGENLCEAGTALQGNNMKQTVKDLGSVFLLDLLLGNPDRLPSPELNWRGNLNNLLFGNSVSSFPDRIVAIDSCVQRKPPAMQTNEEDKAIHRVIELVLNDQGMARKVLKDVISGVCFEQDLEVAGDAAVSGFQAGVKNCLEKVLKIKGLMEMVHMVMSDWMAEFLSDIEEISNSHLSNEGNCAKAVERSVCAIEPSEGNETAGVRPSGTREVEASTTMKLRQINKVTKQDSILKRRVKFWRGRFKERGEALKKAVLEWQERNNVDRCLTTGFLDGTQPIVDTYELQIRLEHILRRLKVLSEAAGTERPVHIVDNLYVGSAVASQAWYTLQHLGITHIVNVTEDVLFPADSWCFEKMRIPIRDTDDQDISSHFEEVKHFIADAAEKGGSVLIHCQEGKSRSVTLILAYIMRTQKCSLKEALNTVHRSRPEARPNGGFMEALLKLDMEINGVRSMTVKSSKPKLRVCPECGEGVGISVKSLTTHIKQKHGIQ